MTVAFALPFALLVIRANVWADDHERRIRALEERWTEVMSIEILKHWRDQIALWAAIKHEADTALWKTLDGVTLDRHEAIAAIRELLDGLECG
jgi:hypothetical protein